MQASPARRIRDEAARHLLVFGLLADPTGEDLRTQPYAARREQLTALLTLATTPVL